MSEDYQGLKILFVGLNTIDLQFLVDVYPAPNSKTKAAHHEIYVGGPATNAAITCAHLGSLVDLYSPVGNHALTGFILEDLKRHRVHLIDPVSQHGTQPVFASIITNKGNGDRSILSYHPENKFSGDDYINFNLKQYGLVMFDGFHPEFAVPLARECRKSGIVTVLDGGSWKPGMEQLLTFIDIAIFSNDFSVENGRDPQAIFEYLKGMKIRMAAITRGEKSILYYEEKHTGELVAQRVSAADTLGAGDIFHGAFCHYFQKSLHFTESLSKAATIAAWSCRTLGTRSWMKKNGGSEERS